jgi:glycerol uptake facilitator-like aquaporin
MPSTTTLRIVLGALSSGLAVFGFLGVLGGMFGMMGFDGCTDGPEICSEYVPRTFDQHAEATLVAFGAFLLGSLVCVLLARDS